MNFKHNINYFKSNDMIKWIGIALCCLTAALYFFGRGFIVRILMYLSLPIGIVLFIIGSSRRSNDADIDEDIEKLGKGVEIDLIEDNNFAKKLNRIFSPMTFEGYEYDDGLMYTKSKSNSVRSSKYTKAIVYVLSDSLYIVKRSFSLVSDEVENLTFEIPFADIDCIELSHENKTVKFEKKSFDVKFVRLNVISNEKITVSLPASDDINTERIIEKMNSTVTIK